MPAEVQETLAKVLDQIEALEDEHGEPIRVYLAVAFSFETKSSVFDGVCMSEDPPWVSLALLGEAYDKVQEHIAKLKAAEADE